MDKLHYLQCKLILEPNDFTSRDSFFDYGWLVSNVVSTLPIGWNPITSVSASRPRIREITFWDTPDFQLRKHNFILRQRVPYQDGFLSGEPEIALKYRVPNMELAASVDMTPNLSDFRLKFKAEALPTQAGGTRLIFSHNGQTVLSALPVGCMGNLEVLAKTFPAVARSLPHTARPLELVNNIYVEEVLQDLGTLGFGHDDTADANIAIWRERGTQKPLCVEFAFEIKVHHMHELKEKALEKSERLFIAMQAHSKLMLGVTKTELVYRGV